MQFDNYIIVICKCSINETFKMPQERTLESCILLYKVRDIFAEEKTYNQVKHGPGKVTSEVKMHAKVMKGI